MAIEARHVLGFALTAGMLGCGGSNATAPAPLPRAHLDLGRVRIPNATDIGEARTLVGVATFIGAAVSGEYGEEAECVVDFGDGSPPATAHVRLPTFPVNLYEDFSWPVCGGMHAYRAPGRYEVVVTASMGRETRSVQDPITVTSLTGTWVGQPAFVREPVVLELVQEDATLTGTARWQGKVSRLFGTISYHRENGRTPSGTYWRQPFHLDFVVEPFPRTSGDAPAGRYLEQTDRPFEILWPVGSWATSIRLDREPVP